MDYLIKKLQELGQFCLTKVERGQIGRQEKNCFKNYISKKSGKCKLVANQPKQEVEKEKEKKPKCFHAYQCETLDQPFRQSS